MQKQIDIFGNEVDVDVIFATEKNLLHGGRITKKSLFRLVNGFKEGCYCKNCNYFVEKEHNRKYFKCKNLGVSSSKATDIRKNDIACNLYQEK